MSATEHLAGTGPDHAIKGDIDEPFRRSVAALSEQLAARPVDPTPRFDAEDRPWFAPRERESGRSGRSIVWVLGFALGAVAGAGLLYSFFDGNAPATSPAPTAVAAPPAPSPPAQIITAAPPAPPPAIDRRVVEKPQPPPAPAPPQKEAAAPPAEPAKLTSYEVMEVQTRLKDLGVEPAMMLDGRVGRQTRAAVRRYEESKGHEPTGVVNRTLLNRLRQDTKKP